MGYVKGVLAAIAALPVIIGAVRELIGFFESKFGPDWPKRMEELRGAKELIAKAQTDKERDDAILALARAFNSKS